MIALRFVNNLVKDLSLKKDPCGAGDAAFTWDSSSYYHSHSFAFLDEDPFASPELKVVPTFSTPPTGHAATNRTRKRSGRDFKAVYPKRRRRLDSTTFASPCTSPTGYSPLLPAGQDLTLSPIETVSIEDGDIQPSSKEFGIRPQLATVENGVHDKSDIGNTGTVPVPNPKPPRVTPMPPKASRGHSKPFSASLRGLSIRSFMTSCYNSVRWKAPPRPPRPMDSQRWVPPSKRTRRVFNSPSFTLPNIRFRRAPRYRPNPFANMPYPIPFFEPGPHQDCMYSY